jgi:hypothetical protein|tara:strand:- start:1998 stop:2336 length:339 start_codon:yes stop_codon:yes gene_type:complete
MSDKFYESDVVREEIKAMEELYTELARLSIKYDTLTEEEKVDHINNTLMLIAKQKVFYGRLNLMATEDKEAARIKAQLDKMSQVYSNGQSIHEVLTQMEDKLRTFRGALDND